VNWEFIMTWEILSTIGTLFICLLEREAENNRSLLLLRIVMPHEANLRRNLARITSVSAPGSSKSLQKALRILLHMGQGNPDMGIAELASELDLNKTTVYRLLCALEKFGLVERLAEGENYRLGLKLHELGTHAIESRSLRTEAHSFLIDLAQKSGESVHLAVPGPRGAICLDHVESKTRFMMRTAIGATFELHCSAIGKAVVAFLPDDEMDALLSAQEFTKYTAYTRTRPSEIKKDLREVVKRGYALDRQESEVGINCIAVPLHLPLIRGTGAVGMSGPTNRFRGKALREKIAMNKETVALIAERLRG
jgi:IclR family transcriptional regulator, KDG regulon repressor